MQAAIRPLATGIAHAGRTRSTVHFNLYRMRAGTGQGACIKSHDLTTPSIASKDSAGIYQRTIEVQTVVKVACDVETSIMNGMNFDLLPGVARKIHCSLGLICSIANYRARRDIGRGALWQIGGGNSARDIELGCWCRSPDTDVAGAGYVDTCRRSCLIENKEIVGPVIVNVAPDRKTTRIGIGTELYGCLLSCAACRLQSKRGIRSVNVKDSSRRRSPNPDEARRILVLAELCRLLRVDFKMDHSTMKSTSLVQSNYFRRHIWLHQFDC